MSDTGLEGGRGITYAFQASSGGPGWGKQPVTIAGMQ